MTELYAIFHKPTGKYMPARMFKIQRNGWTWWEPTGANGLGGVDPEVPRLFTKRNAAIQAMGYWLNGNYALSYDETSQHLKNSSPIIPRKPSDVEIHALKLVITSVI